MKNLILSSLLLLTTLHLSAQVQGGGSVTGRVLDGAMAGEPLMGATVRVPGVQVGTTTDMDGRFTLEMPAGKVLLQISMMGYKTQVVNVKGKSVVEVTLQEDNKVLDEVVVVGYGSMKKRDLTGAMSQIKSEDLVAGGATDLAHGMQGKIAGVQVSSSDNAPGSGVSITVRGANSFTTSSQPLYIVDGVPYNENPNGTPASAADNNPQETNPLNFISPNDIDKIEVLKDASATAIYGSRGANGVIIITTKKGTRGKNNVRYSGSLTVSRRARKLDLLNAREWATVSKSAWGNRGGYTDEEIAALGEGTDWQDAVLRTAVSQRHEVSFDGGDERTRYLLSAGYTGENGIVIGSDFRRYNLRANVERKLSDVFQLAVVTTVGKSVQHALSTTEPVNYKSSPFSGGITNSLTYALFMPPVVPVYNADGSYNCK